MSKKTKPSYYDDEYERLSDISDTTDDETTFFTRPSGEALAHPGRPSGLRTYKLRDDDDIDDVFNGQMQYDEDTKRRREKRRQRRLRAKARKDLQENKNYQMDIGPLGPLMNPLHERQRQIIKDLLVYEFEQRDLYVPNVLKFKLTPIKMMKWMYKYIKDNKNSEHTKFREIAQTFTRYAKEWNGKAPFATQEEQDAFFGKKNWVNKPTKKENDDFREDRDNAHNMRRVILGHSSSSSSSSISERTKENKETKDPCEDQAFILRLYPFTIIEYPDKLKDYDPIILVNNMTPDAVRNQQRYVNKKLEAFVHEPTKKFQFAEYFIGPIGPYKEREFMKTSPYDPSIDVNQRSFSQQGYSFSHPESQFAKEFAKFKKLDDDMFNDWWTDDTGCIFARKFAYNPKDLHQSDKLKERSSKTGFLDIHAIVRPEDIIRFHEEVYAMQPNADKLNYFPEFHFRHRRQRVLNIDPEYKRNVLRKLIQHCASRCLSIPKNTFLNRVVIHKGKLIHLGDRTQNVINWYQMLFRVHLLLPFVTPAIPETNLYYDEDRLPRTHHCSNMPILENRDRFAPQTPMEWLQPYERSKHVIVKMGTCNWFHYPVLGPDIDSLGNKWNLMIPFLDMAHKSMKNPYYGDPTTFMYMAYRTAMCPKVRARCIRPFDKKAYLYCATDSHQRVKDYQASKNNKDHRLGQFNQAPYDLLEEKFIQETSYTPKQLKAFFDKLTNQDNIGTRVLTDEYWRRKLPQEALDYLDHVQTLADIDDKGNVKFNPYVPAFPVHWIPEHIDLGFDHLEGLEREIQAQLFTHPFTRDAQPLFFYKIAMQNGATEKLLNDMWESAAGRSAMFSLCINMHTGTSELSELAVSFMFVGNGNVNASYYHHNNMSDRYHLELPEDTFAREFALPQMSKCASPGYYGYFSQPVHAIQPYQNDVRTGDIEIHDFRNVAAPPNERGEQEFFWYTKVPLWQHKNIDNATYACTHVFEQDVRFYIGNRKPMHHKPCETTVLSWEFSQPVLANHITNTDVWGDKVVLFKNGNRFDHKPQNLIVVPWNSKPEHFKYAHRLNFALRQTLIHLATQHINTTGASGAAFHSRYLPFFLGVNTLDIWAKAIADTDHALVFKDKSPKNACLDPVAHARYERFCAQWFQTGKSVDMVNYATIRKTLKHWVPLHRFINHNYLMLNDETMFAMSRAMIDFPEVPYYLYNPDEKDNYRKAEDPWRYGKSKVEQFAEDNHHPYTFRTEGIRFCVPEYPTLDPKFTDVGDFAGHKSKDQWDSIRQHFHIHSRAQHSWINLLHMRERRIKLGTWNFDYDTHLRDFANQGYDENLDDDLWYGLVNKVNIDPKNIMARLLNTYDAKRIIKRMNTYPHDNPRFFQYQNHLGKWVSYVPEDNMSLFDCFIGALLSRGKHKQVVVYSPKRRTAKEDRKHMLRMFRRILHLRIYNRAKSLGYSNLQFDIGPLFNYGMPKIKRNSLYFKNLIGKHFPQFNVSKKIVWVEKENPVEPGVKRVFKGPWALRWASVSYYVRNKAFPKNIPKQQLIHQEYLCYMATRDDHYRQIYCFWKYVAKDPFFDKEIIPIRVPKYIPHFRTTYEDKVDLYAQKKHKKHKEKLKRFENHRQRVLKEDPKFMEAMRARHRRERRRIQRKNLIPIHQNIASAWVDAHEQLCQFSEDEEADL